MRLVAIILCIFSWQIVFLEVPAPYHVLNNLETFTLQNNAHPTDTPVQDELPGEEQPQEQQESPNDSDGNLHLLQLARLHFINNNFPVQSHPLTSVYWEISTPPPES